MPEATSVTLAAIAILDDDADFRNYLEDFLKDEGSYSVRAFANPSELFESCEESLPDIVLLDMKMGEASGDKVLEQLLEALLCVGRREVVLLQRTDLAGQIGREHVELHLPLAH